MCAVKRNGEQARQNPGPCVVQDALRAAAAATGLTSALREGVYAGVSGPTYESPAEIHALRILGGDTGARRAGSQAFVRVGRGACRG